MWPRDQNGAHKCKVCPEWRAASKAALEAHNAREHGASRHSCSICHKQQSDSNNLRRHMRNSHGDRKAVKVFRCKGCQSTFAGRSDNAKRHVKTTKACKGSEIEVIEAGDSPRKEKTAARRRKSPAAPSSSNDNTEPMEVDHPYVESSVVAAAEQEQAQQQLQQPQRGMHTMEGQMALPELHPLQDFNLAVGYMGGPGTGAAVGEEMVPDWNNNNNFNLSDAGYPEVPISPELFQQLQLLQQSLHQDSSSTFQSSGNVPTGAVSAQPNTALENENSNLDPLYTSAIEVSMSEQHLQLQPPQQQSQQDLPSLPESFVGYLMDDMPAELYAVPENENENGVSNSRPSLDAIEATIPERQQELQQEQSQLSSSHATPFLSSLFSGESSSGSSGNIKMSDKPFLSTSGPINSNIDPMLLDNHKAEPQQMDWEEKKEQPALAPEPQPESEPEQEPEPADLPPRRSFFEDDGLWASLEYSAMEQSMENEMDLGYSDFFRM